MESDAVLELLQHAAGEYIRPRFRALDESQVHEKNPGDLVTVADREAEVFLTAELAGAYPGATILGEEATATDPGLEARAVASEHVFTIDPVDGTRNFVAGSPDYAVMVAEVRSGRVVRSWILQPEHDAAFVAELGSGAWTGENRLRTPAATGAPLQGAVSDPHLFAQDPRDLAPVSETWQCCGVDYPRLAQGSVDYLAYRHTRAWDHLPGMLLVSEAGGASSRLDGTEFVLAEPAAPWVVSTGSSATLPQVREALAEALA